MAKTTVVRREVPYGFFLEAADSDSLIRKPMFGSWAFYRDDKILFIVRESQKSHFRDNGIWLVCEPEHQPAVRAELTSLRPIELFESEKPGAWINLPADSELFEEEALKLAEMIVAGDERIGRVPKGRPKSMTRRAAKSDASGTAERVAKDASKKSKKRLSSKRPRKSSKSSRKK